MARFAGFVGYGETVESAPSVFKMQFTEVKYFGDVIRETIKQEEGESVNNNLALQHSVSVIADAYALNHVHAIRYVRWTGALWEVKTAFIASPRLVLRLGGVYHGPSA